MAEPERSSARAPSAPRPRRSDRRSRRIRVRGRAPRTLAAGFLALALLAAGAEAGLRATPTKTSLSATLPAPAPTTTGASSSPTGGGKGQAVKPGPAGPTFAPIYTTNGVAKLLFQAWQIPASLTLPAGNYLILARVAITLTAGSDTLGASCALDAGYADAANNADPVDSVSGEEGAAVWTLVGVVHFEKTGYASVQCTQSAASVSSVSAVLTAMEGGSIVHQ